MYYLDFLRALHEALAPPTYLEIGVRHGDSLALARGAAVGIDPAYKLTTELPDDVELFRETSDEYFARRSPLEPFGGRRIAFAFIDGMHLAEFVVRDFANVERHAAPWSVVVFDDILPRTATEAARDRRTRAWTGDVYKTLFVLGEHRPELVCLRVDTEPSGLGVILNLDPESTVLRDRYDAIVRDVLVPDPQDVPRDVLERRGAVDPETLLASSIWPRLRDARTAGPPRVLGRRPVRRALKRELGITTRRAAMPL
jgi:heat shock protein HspQ